MSFPNSLAGSCYRCTRYVAPGAGQLLKNQTPTGQLVANGHRYVVQCQVCSDNPARELPPQSLTPSEDAMNDAAATLVRQAVRDSIRQLLRDADMPADYVRPGQLWLEEKPRPLKALYAFKERLIDLRNEARGKRLAA